MDVLQVGVFVVGGVGVDEAFPLEFGGVAEVDEEADLMSGCFEVVDELGFFGAGEVFGGFEFDDDGVVAEEVDSVFFGEGVAAVVDGEFLLGGEGDVVLGEFAFECFLVDGFEESGAQGVVDGEGGVNDGVYFVCEGKGVFRHSGFILL